MCAGIGSSPLWLWTEVCRICMGGRIYIILSLVWSAEIQMISFYEQQNDNALEVLHAINQSIMMFPFNTAYLTLDEFGRWVPLPQCQGCSLVLDVKAHLDFLQLSTESLLMTLTPPSQCCDLVWLKLSYFTQSFTQGLSSWIQVNCQNLVVIIITILSLRHRPVHSVECSSLLCFIGNPSYSFTGFNTASNLSPICLP